MDYEFHAKAMLKAEMVRNGISLDDLAAMLAKDGLEETPKALSMKINRGKFTLSFFLRCMTLMGLDGTFILLPMNRDDARAPKNARLAASTPFSRPAKRLEGSPDEATPDASDRRQKTGTPQDSTPVRTTPTKKAPSKAGVKSRAV